MLPLSVPLMFHSSLNFYCSKGLWSENIDIIRIHSPIIIYVMINIIVIVVVVIKIIKLSINNQEMNILGEKDKLKFLPKVSLICSCCTFVHLYIWTVKAEVRSEKFLAVKLLTPRPSLLKLPLLLIIISVIVTIISIILTIITIIVTITIISIIVSTMTRVMIDGGYLLQSQQWEYVREGGCSPRNKCWISKNYLKIFN